jgi:hypothetical protein
MGLQKLREASITKHLKNLKVGIKRSVKLEFKEKKQMSNITEVWENERLAYQQRYVMWLKRWENYHNEDDRGHANECSYVLINIFGLTDGQIKELEHNYSGLTNDDLN